MANLVTGVVAAVCFFFQKKRFGYAFAWANWVAFSFGMAVALCALSTSNAHHQMLGGTRRSARARFAVTARKLGRFCFVLFVVAMVRLFWATFRGMPTANAEG